MEPFLREYIKQRPLFLGLIRARESAIYQQFLPFKGPVLDVGCGDGYFAKVTFAKRAKSKEQKSKMIRKNDSQEYLIDVGLDVEDSRIHEAEHRGVYKKLVTYDGHVFPFKDNSFQTVVSNCVFEHIPNIDETISEIYRVLKPGGHLITTVMADKWEDYMWGKRLGNWYVQWMRRKQVHFNLLSSPQWKKKFTSTGFKVDTEIGYLGEGASELIDIAHYISIPNLFSYKWTGRWVLFPQFASFLPLTTMVNTVQTPVPPTESSALFYVLKK